MRSIITMFMVVNCGIENYGQYYYENPTTHNGRVYRKFGFVLTVNLHPVNSNLVI